MRGISKELIPTLSGRLWRTSRRSRACIRTQNDGNGFAVVYFPDSHVSNAQRRMRDDMTFNYEGRVFRSISNSAGGDVSGETTFHYRQRGFVTWATYAGGSVVFGTLLAKVGDGGSLDMRYQHLTTDGAFRSGRCNSRPEALPNGRLRLHEQWTWTDGAQGEGVSILEEIP